MVIKGSSRLTEMAPRLAAKIELMKISAMQVRVLLLSLKSLLKGKNNIMILWMKTSEILPSNNCRCLIYLPNSELKVCLCWYDKTFGFYYNHLNQKLNPTHWASFEIPE